MDEHERGPCACLCYRPPTLTYVTAPAVPVKVRKERPGQGVFSGRVVCCKHNLYQVRYEDEEEEEMTRDELLEFLVADGEGSGSEIEKDAEHDPRRLGRRRRGLDTDTEIHRSDANDEPEDPRGSAPVAKQRNWTKSSNHARWT